jgi:hypothetical protein
MARTGRPIIWDREKIARLGFLVGAHWTRQSIADHFETTEENIRQMCCSLGLRVNATFEFPYLPEISAAAQKRRKTTAELLEELAKIINQEPSLIAAILDDGKN